MAQQFIDFGNSTPNNGDTIFDAFSKVNSNVTDLQTAIITSSDSVFNEVKVGKGAGNILTNTIVGRSALALNTTGLRIVSLGNQSLPVNTTGSYNTVIGDSSAFNNTTGSYITAIGQGALSNNTIFNNIIGLGFNSQATASNQINLGDAAITSLRCNVQVITSLSDERDKKDILEISEGLDFISKLKPVTFTWNQRDGNRVDVKSAGFIAQDLLKLQNDSLIGENLDLVSENDPNQLEARYANLMPVMIKAIQELNELLKSK